MSNKVRKITGMSLRPQAAAAMTAVGLCAAVAVPASAQPNPNPAKSPNHLRASRHCVVHLAEQGRATCYDSFRKAIADASGWQITDAPDSAAGVDPRLDARINALPGAKKRGASALGGIVLSIEYVDINFGSSTFTFTGNRECTGPISDLDYQYPDLAVRGWDNVISSFKTYANCFVNHFENPNYGGIRTGYQGTRSYIGDAMNDRTSSLQWS
jgi:hypothetical protein